MSDPLIEELEKVSIQYPGKRHLTLLSDLIKEGEIVNFLTKQYPGAERTGNVQFIPELRGKSGVTFLNKGLLQPADAEKYATNIAGELMERMVQDQFASLRDSDLLSDRSMVVMHNVIVGKENILFEEIKDLWTNEFDLILFDPTYGVFIEETKSSVYKKLKNKQKKKQEDRYNLLSKIRKFYGKKVKLPIHTLLICKSDNADAESQIIKAECKNTEHNDYRIVIKLNVKEDFTKIWKKTLDCLDTVSNLPLPEGNVTEFAAVIYAIQMLDDIPSAVHRKFTEQEFQKLGKKNKYAILWSREQKEILDHYDEQCLMNEGSRGKMRLCISGCFGSGKTMLLIKFAQQFTDKYPDSQILFLVDSNINILLLDTLRNCTQLSRNGNITFALSTEFTSYNSDVDTFLESCKQYQLIVVDEYMLLDDDQLDVSNLKDSHLALVTSYISTATLLPAEFKKLTLSGSLRATKDIIEYIKEVQLSEGQTYPMFPVKPAHTISYRPVTTMNNFDSGEQCVEQCITCITEIFTLDCKESIIVIGNLHRWFLYRLSMRFADKNIPHQFKLHRNSLQYSANSSDNTDQSNVTLCDYYEATGSECSTVIVVSDEVIYAGAGSLYAISRATTQAFVYKMDFVYNDDIPINRVPALSTHTAQDIKIPSYTDAGEKDRKAFIDYVNNLVENGITGQNKVYPDEEKKILVTYYIDGDKSIINQIEESLPPELQRVIVFVDYDDDTSYYSLDFSKDFILMIYCYCGGAYYTDVFTTTILPIVLVTLVSRCETYFVLNAAESH